MDVLTLAVAKQYTDKNRIINAISLPTENINEHVLYRLLTAKFVSNCYSYVDTWKCYCVNELPDIGEPVLTDMQNVTAYYNVSDKAVYGYVDSNLSVAAGLSVGWYPIETLSKAFDITYGGVINDVDGVDDDSAKVLLQQDFYIYQNGWTKLAIGYEKMPEFDITWNGDMTDKLSLDLSAFGYDAGYYLTKVSDNMYTSEQVINGTILTSGNDTITITESSIDSSTIPGVLYISDVVVIIYSSDDFNTACGLPSGTYTNGVYFFIDTSSGFYIRRFTAPSKITKIDSKYLNISEYSTTTEVESMIATAIGNVIGGSY